MVNTWYDVMDVVPGFVIRWQFQCDDWINFRIMEITGDDGQGVSVFGESLLYIDDAEPYITGHIKAEGCSGWNFQHYYHCCSKDEAVAIGTVLSACYDIAKAQMPDWDGDRSADRETDHGKAP
jgi:hypothetical protein